MNTHLSEEQQLGYVQHTLTDAEREMLERHLVGCPKCRAQIEEHEIFTRSLRHSLNAALQSCEPPEMLRRQRETRRRAPSPLPGIVNHLRRGVPVALALAGLVLAWGALWIGADFPAGRLTPNAPHVLPTAACFLLGIPVATQYRGDHAVRRRNRWLGLLVGVLWLGMAAVGLYDIFLLREMVLRLCARLGSNYWTAVATGEWSTFLFSIVWIAVFIGGSEYHYRHFDRRSSWRLFGWTILGEIAVLLLTLFI
ncbi:MAG: zf-HC2 domain-containing protein [Anaerolineae bacterium]|nr:zf-HC2 domain-containing protein [Anaerolineae bacterium]